MGRYAPAHERLLQVDAERCVYSNLLATCLLNFTSIRFHVDVTCVSPTGSCLHNMLGSVCTCARAWSGFGRWTRRGVYISTCLQLVYSILRRYDSMSMSLVLVQRAPAYTICLGRYAPAHVLGVALAGGRGEVCIFQLACNLFTQFYVDTIPCRCHLC